MMSKDDVNYLHNFSSVPQMWNCKTLFPEANLFVWLWDAFLLAKWKSLLFEKESCDSPQCKQYSQDHRAVKGGRMT